MIQSKRVPFLIIILILAGVAVFFYKGYQSWLASLSPQFYPVRDYRGKEEIQKEQTPLEVNGSEEKPRENKPLTGQISYGVYLSSNNLEQGDTLLIRVESQSGIDKLTGAFGSEKIDFFKSATGEWFAIVGIDAKKEPGSYDLNISFPGNEFKKELNVVKRDFPITELLVTKELEEKGYTPSKIAENIATKDNPSIQEILQIYTPQTYFNQPFNYPLKEIKVVGDYGNIRKSGEITLQHLGVDLDASIGTPVYAINDGVVRFSEDLINYGKTIIIDHGLGIHSLYLHLEEFKVLRGERVARGDIIGFSGNTGYSITAHLHFSVKANGASVDPLRFIETTEKEMGL